MSKKQSTEEHEFFNKAMVSVEKIGLDATINNLVQNFQSFDNKAILFHTLANLYRAQGNAQYTFMSLARSIIEDERYMSNFQELQKMARISSEHTNKSIDFIFEEDFENAAAELEKGIVFNPFNLTNYVVEAVICEKINRIDVRDKVLDTLNNIREMVDTDSNMRLLNLYLEDLSSAGLEDLSNEVYVRTIKSFTKNDILKYSFGKDLLKQKRYYDALNLFESIEENNKRINPCGRETFNNILDCMRSSKEQVTSESGLKYKSLNENIFEKEIFSAICLYALYDKKSSDRKINNFFNFINEKKIYKEEIKRYLNLIHYYKGMIDYDRGDFCSSNENLMKIEDIRNIRDHIDPLLMSYIAIDNKNTLNDMDYIKKLPNFVDLDFLNKYSKFEKLLNIRSMKQSLEIILEIGDYYKDYFKSRINLEKYQRLLLNPQEMIKNISNEEEAEIAIYESLNGILEDTIELSKPIAIIGASISHGVDQYINKIVVDDEDNFEEVKEQIEKLIGRINSNYSQEISISELNKNKLKFEINIEGVKSYIVYSRKWHQTKNKVFKFKKSFLDDEENEVKFKNLEQRFNLCLLSENKEECEREDIVKIYSDDDHEIRSSSEFKFVSRLKQLKNVCTPKIKNTYASNKYSFASYEEVKGPDFQDFILNYDLSDKKKTRKFRNKILKKHIEDLIEMQCFDFSDIDIDRKNVNFYDKLLESISDLDSYKSKGFFERKNVKNALKSISKKIDEGYKTDFLDRSLFNAIIDLEDQEKGIYLYQIDFDQAWKQTFFLDDYIQIIDNPLLKLKPKERKYFETKYKTEILQQKPELADEFDSTLIYGGFYRNLRFWHHYSNGDIKEPVEGMAKAYLDKSLSYLQKIIDQGLCEDKQKLIKLKEILE
ncbi:hypothetical protein KY334_05095 [Candidatus Woesearchaeota archaeon]|nr:hypothetical protein [Candidatus Woesearchaeota archaeon]